MTRFCVYCIAYRLRLIALVRPVRYGVFISRRRCGGVKAECKDLATACAKEIEIR